MQKGTAPTAVNSKSWNIEISATTVPREIRERYQQIENDAVGWDTRLVDFQLDQRGNSTDLAVVLHRVDAWRKGKNAANLIIKQILDDEDHSNIDHKTAGQSIRTRSSQYTLWAGRMAWLEKPSHYVNVSTDMAVDSATVDFGSLPSVRSMGSDELRLVVGFDTEYVSYDDEGHRDIVSYQFSWIDLLDGCEHEVVIMPLENQRLLVSDCLYVVSLLGELERYANGFNDAAEIGASDMDSRGVLRSELGGNLRDSLFKRASVRIVLAGHFLNVDATAFRRPKRRYDDILHKLTSAGGGLVSLQPVRVVRTSGVGSYRRVYPFSVVFRDTRNQASPDHKSLKALGDACGVEKLDVGDAIEDMRLLARENLPRFLEYAANDARIVVHYLGTVWGYNITPPVTISSGGAKALKSGILEYWLRGGFIDSRAVDDAVAGSGIPGNSIFRRMFQGLKTRKVELEADSDSLEYYAVRGLEPVDGDARVSHALWADSFAGGYNTCPSPGVHAYSTYDWDLQSAYPTAMACIFDPDYTDGGVIDVHVDKRELSLDDFPLGPLTSFVGFVSWVFPSDVVAPCLPVRRGNSLIYPQTSYGCGFDEGEGLSHRLDEDGLDRDGEDRGGRDYTREQLDDIAARVNGEVGGVFHGATCAGPEVWLALKLGARVFCQTGITLKLLTREVDGVEERSRSLRSALRQMVVDRVTAKGVYGKKSLEELTIKVATNSCYGKLAQDVVDQNGWNAYSEEMENIGGSAVTSPYHASMTTSLVRATLLAVSNQTAILSATTDGVITADDDLEKYDLFGLADILRESRVALADDDSIWEIKHRQSDLVNLSTRANVSCEVGGVLAKGGIKTPKV